MRIGFAIALALCAGCSDPVSVGSTDEAIRNGYVYTLPNPGLEWLVQVKNVTDGSFCSGVLLTPAYVLTDYHCVKNGAASGIAVIAPFISGSGNESSGYQVFVHPDYRVYNGNQYFDLALVWLKYPLPLPNHGGYNWRMPIHDYMPPIGQWQTALGYGVSTNSFTSDGTQGAARYAGLQVTDYGWYGDYIFSPNANGQIVSAGDSGGPSFFNTSNGWALTGVHQFSEWSNGAIDRSWDISITAGYTRSVHDWILDYMPGSLPEY